MREKEGEEKEGEEEEGEEEVSSQHLHLSVHHQHSVKNHSCD